MKKVNLMIAALMAAAMYVINPYTDLTRLQELALMVAYLMIGSAVSAFFSIAMEEIADRRKRKKFRRMIRQTTL